MKSIGLLVLFLSLAAFHAGTDHMDTPMDPFEPYYEEIAGSPETIKMLPIAGGTFLMGSQNGTASESPVHEVSIGDFWMGAYEITWDQYELFASGRAQQLSTPKDNEIDIAVDAIASATTPYVDMSHGMGKKGYPVVNVTQYAALSFCQWLSAKTGRFYRLPTEAEWEYACRAGSKDSYFFGNDTTLLDTYAWYRVNSNKAYHKIGLKNPNSFGLYDMHGNVAEWTMDQFLEGAYLERAGTSTSNPWVVPVTLYPRTVRGGSWQDSAKELRSAARKGSEARWKRIDPQIPKSRWWFTNAPDVGFRIVRPKNTPSSEEIARYWLEAIDDF